MAAILLIGLMISFVGWQLYRRQKRADFNGPPPTARGAELAEKVASALLAKDKEHFLAILRDLRLVGSGEELILKTASQRFTPRLLVYLLSRYCWWCWVGLSELELTEKAALVARQLTSEYKNQEALGAILEALCQNCRFGERIKAAVRRRKYLSPSEIASDEAERSKFEEAIRR